MDPLRDRPKTGDKILRIPRRVFDMDKRTRGAHSLDVFATGRIGVWVCVSQLVQPTQSRGGVRMYKRGVAGLLLGQLGSVYAYLTIACLTSFISICCYCDYFYDLFVSFIVSKKRAPVE